MTKTRVCSGWRGRELMKSRKREPFIECGVRLGSSRRCFATMDRKGGKSIASLWMKVGMMFSGSHKFGSSLRQKKAPAKRLRFWRVAQVELADVGFPITGEPENHDVLLPRTLSSPDFV